MKTKEIIVCASSVILASSVFAKEYTLQPKFEAEARNVIDLSNDMDMTMNVMGQQQKMKMFHDMKMKQDILKKEKGAEITYGFERMKLNMNAMGVDISYDSNLENQVNPMAQKMDAEIRPLLKMQIQVTVDDAGKPVEIKGVEDNPALKQLGVAPKDLVQSLDQQNMMLPKKAVSINETWESVIQVPLGQGNNADTKLKVTLVGVEAVNGEQIATLSYTGTFEGKMEQQGMQMKMKCDDYKGKADFNITKGRYQNAKAEMTIAMEMGEMGTATIDLKSIYTIQERKKVLR